MKKLLLISKNSLPNVSSLLNITREKNAKNYDIKFFLDDDMDQPSPIRSLLKSLGYFVFENTYNNFEETFNGLSEIIDTYGPDIIVNDNSYCGALAAKVKKIKKYIAILRRPDFPGEYKTQEEKEYFTEILEKNIMPLLKKFSNKQPNDPRELLLSKHILVPSVPYFDNITVHEKYKSKLIYAGIKLWDIGDISEETMNWIETAKKNKAPMILFTCGLEYDGTRVLENLLNLFNNWRFNVLVTFHNPAQFKGSYDEEKIHMVPLIPLRYISKEFHAIVHHGGHQTSLLALDCGLPAVTFATGIPQWEENSLITESLSTSIHTRIPTAESIINNLETVLNSGFIQMGTEMSQNLALENQRECLPFIEALG